VSHSHGDHFSASQIDAVRWPNARIIVPELVFNSLSAAQKAIAIILRNGESTNIMDLTVEAVPAYKANHPRGQGNGYVVTIGGKRFYMTGDAGSTAEMRALQDIDVAFLCINNAVHDDVERGRNRGPRVWPKAVYPCHYRNSGGSLTDLNPFKQQVGADGEVEVRARKWC